MGILVVGSIAFDTIRTPFGEEPHAQGGSAVYFSLAASRFAPVQLVGVVGEDFTGEHLKVFEGRPIDLAGLERRPGRTFHWAGEYRYDMNEAETRSTELNVFETFDPKVPDAFRAPDFLFLGNIDPALQRRVLDQVERPRLVAADTMNFWISSRRKELEELLRGVDLLVINEGEARMLGNDVNVRRAARAILELGPRTLVVKRGEYGVLMFGPDGTFAAPGLPLETVVDPTGAGDSFAGGMMGTLAAAGEVSDGALRRALVHGCVMASFTVEAFGVRRLAAVTDAEVRERVRTFQQLTHFERV